MSLRYAIHALPDDLRDLFDEESSGPVGDLILAAFLDASIAVASSAVARCALPDGRTMPPTSYGILEAESGTRKTYYSQLLTAPILSWTERQKDKEGIDINRHQAAETIWNAKIRVLSRQIDKRVEAGDPTDDLQDQLAKTYSEKPKTPTNRSILLDDTTTPAALRTLAERHFAALMPDEAGTAMLSTQPKDSHTLAALWGGSPIQINRVGEAPLEASGQLTILFPIQPDILRAIEKKKGHFLKASGLNARFQHYLVPPGHPDPTHLRAENAGKALARYGDRMHAVLDGSLGIKKVADLHEINFSARAARALGKIVHDYRTDMLDQRNAHCQDYLAKMGDHIARWATRYHVFLGLEGSIQPEMVERGDAIMRYHLKVFDRLHMPRRRATTSREPAWRREAKALHRWLLDHPGGFYHSEIGQIAMVLGMPYTSRIRRAIYRLEDYDLVRINERHNDLIIRSKRSLLDIDYD